jgi:hypothetical protein
VDIAFGLRARIEGWSIRPKRQPRKEGRRKEKVFLASHHHRRNLLFLPGVGSPSPGSESTPPLQNEDIPATGWCKELEIGRAGTPEHIRAEALSCCKTFSLGGGFVFTAVHNIQAASFFSDLITVVSTSSV